MLVKSESGILLLIPRHISPAKTNEKIARNAFSVKWVNESII